MKCALCNSRDATAKWFNGRFCAINAPDSFPEYAKPWHLCLVCLRQSVYAKHRPGYIIQPNPERAAYLQASDKQKIDAAYIARFNMRYLASA